MESTEPGGFQRIEALLGTVVGSLNRIEDRLTAHWPGRVTPGADRSVRLVIELVPGAKPKMQLGAWMPDAPAQAPPFETLTGAKAAILRHVVELLQVGGKEIWLWSGYLAYPEEWKGQNYETVGQQMRGNVSTIRTSITKCLSKDSAQLMIGRFEGEVAKIGMEEKHLAECSATNLIQAVRQARAAFENGRRDDAIPAARRALSIDPNSFVANALLVLLDDASFAYACPGRGPRTPQEWCDEQLKHMNSAAPQTRAFERDGALPPFDGCGDSMQEALSRPEARREALKTLLARCGKPPPTAQPLQPRNTITPAVYEDQLAIALNTALIPEKRTAAEEKLGMRQAVICLRGMERDLSKEDAVERIVDAVYRLHEQDKAFPDWSAFQKKLTYEVRRPSNRPTALRDAGTLATRRDQAYARTGVQPTDEAVRAELGWGLDRFQRALDASQAGPDLPLFDAEHVPNPGPRPDVMDPSTLHITVFLHHLLRDRNGWTACDQQEHLMVIWHARATYLRRHHRLPTDEALADHVPSSWSRDALQSVLDLECTPRLIEVGTGEELAESALLHRDALQEAAGQTGIAVTVALKYQLLDDDDWTAQEKARELRNWWERHRELACAPNGKMKTDKELLDEISASCARDPQCVLDLKQRPSMCSMETTDELMARLLTAACDPALEESDR